MPDMRLNTAPTSLTNNVTNRSALDSVANEMANSQFLELMMARLNATPQGNDEEIKVLAQKVAQNKGTDKADNMALLNRLQNLRDKEIASAPDSTVTNAAPATKAEVKERVKARIKEIAESNTVPVNDTAALETLQKVAKFLLQADEEGKIELSPEIAAQLQAFLAKGNDLKAYDIANFMQGFIDSLRHSIVNMNTSSDNGDVLEWPQEVVDALKEVGLSGLVSNGKPVDMFQAMRVVKALVTQSEKAATDTLNVKSQEAVAAQDQAQVLAVNATAAATTALVAEKQQAPAEKAAAPAAAPVAVVHEQAAKAPVAAENAASSLVASAAAKVTVSDLEKVSTKADKKSDPSLTQIAMNTVGQKKSADAKSGDKGSDANNSNPKAQDLGRGNAPSAGQNNAVLANEIKFAAAAPVEANLGSSSSSNVTNVNGVSGVSQSTAARAANVAAATGLENKQPSAATQQVMVQIQQKLNKDTSISVQLTPAELGRVEVRMNIGRDGQVQTIVSADRPETLAMLQKDASHLEKALQNAGLNANTSNMSFNLREERQAQQFGQGRKRFNRETIDDGAIKDVSLNVLADGQIISDNRINYHA